MSDGITEVLGVLVQESPSISAAPPPSACSACDCDSHRKQKTEISELKGKVNSAEVLLWQKKLQLSVAILPRDGTKD